MTEINPIDLGVFIAYGLCIITLGLWVSRGKKGEEKDAEDYFLAGKTLTWWAVGSSLIASNISAEQFIGMSGSGYALGLGIASYEFMAALTLIIVGKFFLPIFIKKGIFTMPQFLELRYDSRVRTVLAVFWLIVYVFVNLTTVMWLGALALNTIVGVPIFYGILGLALFSVVYSLYGGLMAVAWTDVVQVVVLLVGGIITSIIALDQVGGGEGAMAGLSVLYEKAGPNPIASLQNHFDMIIEKGVLSIPDGDGGTKDAWLDLPGLSVLIGGMWVANLFYWGCNQYITQRALAAKSLDEAQKGVLFAGVLKLIIPLVVVIPGIAAYVLLNDPSYGLTAEAISKSDQAYPWLLEKFVPVGLRGLAFAALIAAIVSSLSSMINSISTIFTMDIYKPLLNKDASQTQLVNIGRVAALIALIIAAIVAKPLLGEVDQAFQIIQEYTGFVSPGILAIFLLGLFWKKGTANAALWAGITSIPFSVLLKYTLPNMPFMNRIGIVLILCSAVLVIISLIEGKGEDHPRAIQMDKGLFYTSPAFNVGSILVCVILAMIYTIFY
ncbi:MAG: sodium/sugar symporter [Bacteroidota bacterium]